MVALEGRMADVAWRLWGRIHGAGARCQGFGLSGVPSCIGAS
jgi:hypothetical protein